jgi:2-C-methyl-D-erythritol 4-phosphate cytidylyltransferase
MAASSHQAVRRRWRMIRRRSRSVAPPQTPSLLSTGQRVFETRLADRAHRTDGFGRLGILVVGRRVEDARIESSACGLLPPGLGHDAHARSVGVGSGRCIGSAIPTAPPGRWQRRVEYGAPGGHACVQIVARRSPGPDSIDATAAVERLSGEPLIAVGRLLGRQRSRARTTCPGPARAVERPDDTSRPDIDALASGSDVTTASPHRAPTGRDRGRASNRATSDSAATSRLSATCGRRARRGGSRCHGGPMTRCTLTSSVVIVAGTGRHRVPPWEHARTAGRRWCWPEGRAATECRRSSRPTANKVYLPLGDVPLLAWSLRTLDAVPGTVAMVLVIRPGDETDAEAAIAAAAPATPVTVVAGGPTRAASERAGLVPLRPGIADGSIEVVLVHDGARPLVSAALAGAVARAARRHGGAIPGLPIAGEILVDAGDRLVPADIEHLRGVQTPQGFRARALVPPSSGSPTALRRGRDRRRHHRGRRRPRRRLAGLRTALVERDDFASGTSSKSSKLVHGGLRYLQQGEIASSTRRWPNASASAATRRTWSVLPFLLPMFGRDGIINRKLARLVGKAPCGCTTSPAAPASASCTSDSRRGRPRLHADAAPASASPAPTSTTTPQPTTPASPCSRWPAPRRSTTARWWSTARGAGSRRTPGGPPRRRGSRRRASASGQAGRVGGQRRRRVVRRGPGLDEGADPTRSGRPRASTSPCRGTRCATRSRGRPGAQGPPLGVRRALGDLTYVGTTDTDYDGPLDDPQCTPTTSPTCSRHQRLGHRADHRGRRRRHVGRAAPAREDAAEWAHRRPVPAPQGRPSDERGSSPSPAASSPPTARWPRTPSTPSSTDVLGRRGPNVAGAAAPRSAAPAGRRRLRRGPRRPRCLGRAGLDAVLEHLGRPLRRRGPHRDGHDRGATRLWPSPSSRAPLPAGRSAVRGPLRDGPHPRRRALRRTRARLLARDARRPRPTTSPRLIGPSSGGTRPRRPEQVAAYRAAVARSAPPPSLPETWGARRRHGPERA